jgi:hypothetical protein
MPRYITNISCYSSWYKSGQIDAPITALWPGSTLHYIEALADVRMEDFNVEYAGNRFSWLGNGYSQTELDDTADWAYYIREHDDGEWLSRGERSLRGAGPLSGWVASTSRVLVMAWQGRTLRQSCKECCLLSVLMLMVIPLSCTSDSIRGVLGCRTIQ